MIMFTMILITLLALAITSVLLVIAGGAGMLLVFGDLVVCVGIIWLIVRFFRRRK